MLRFLPGKGGWTLRTPCKSEGESEQKAAKKRQKQERSKVRRRLLRSKRSRR